MIESQKRGSAKNLFDEIERYIGSRTVSEIEATWKLNSFDWHYDCFDCEESKKKCYKWKKKTMGLFDLMQMSSYN